MIPGLEDPLGKGMATHSSILAWEVPQTEEPGGLQSMGSQESDRTEPLSTHAHGPCLFSVGLRPCWVWGWSLSLCSASLLEVASLGRGVPSVSPWALNQDPRTSAAYLLVLPASHPRPRA